MARALRIEFDVALYIVASWSNRGE